MSKLRYLPLVAILAVTSAFMSATRPSMAHTGIGMPDRDDPACPTHDDRAWHSLYDAGRDCHYDHAHGQYLGQWAYDLFGEDAAQIGRTISYPWQTAHENELKHQGYIVHARDVREYGCHPNGSNSDGGVDAFAFQFHGVGVSHGKMARMHSFYAALNLCNRDGDAGQIITGGNADFGQLVSPYKEDFVGYPRFPKQEYDVGVPPYIGEPDLERSSTRQETWNSVTRGSSRPHVDEHQLVGYAFRIQDAIDYVGRGARVTDAGAFAPFEDPVNNSSSYQLYQIEVTIPDLNGDGSRVSFEGFTDVHGNIGEACDVCVPLTIRNAIPGAYTLNITNGRLADRLDVGTVRGGFYDHDIYFDGEPSGWIDLSHFGR
ncbi:MAG: hypothetical protein ACOC8X_11975 [Chloroflexota bacterium]